MASAAEMRSKDQYGHLAYSAYRCCCKLDSEALHTDFETQYSFVTSSVSKSHSPTAELIQANVCIWSARGPWVHPCNVCAGNAGSNMHVLRRGDT